MFIEVRNVSTAPSDEGPAGLILTPVNTHDHGYRTTYQLHIREQDNWLPLRLGTVKIGSTHQQPGNRALRPGQYSALDDESRPHQWFSVGQDDTYYANIARLGTERRASILRALSDIAFSREAFTVAMEHAVTPVSLLRHISESTVLIQFRRIAAGGDRLLGYHFAYTSPTEQAHGNSTLDFKADPGSAPPSNVHVLIGRNGVGKTTLLRRIARAAVPLGSTETDGTFTLYDSPVGVPMGMPMNVVSVCFSAFDPFSGFADVSPEGTLTFEYVGLHIRAGDHSERKSHEDLAAEFTGSLAVIHATGRTQRWASAVDALMTDPAFAAGSVPELVDYMSSTEPDDFSHEVPHRVFSELSSGHAIVLLTLTRLVELVVEQTLVLLDEPESHLHPPLLSAFVRTLSQLLADRNGIAIVATHSPVVLQEVPRSCVWKLSRWGGRAERPSLETFGENVGVLTHEVFGLEVQESGFHALIQQAVAELDTYQDVLDRFGGQLGGEAKGLVRILLADKAAGEDS
ncbi:AAA family ATPase (plasmid) [Streptomyces virginiae]|uniref:AAA family ATPase n=1 Tax=Streptomyces virginiae TaxID=1961 RepID=UPI002DDBADC4|nr:AAA family ATPase [Streptomyces virginiae]WSC82743.1 AAA family ATPase [Streptomyces virginiae]